MSKIRKSVRETIKNLEKQNVIHVKQRRHYQFADSKEEGRELLQEIMMASDTSIENFVWFPEYDNVLNWMVGSNKGMFITGSPGVGKTNIITKVVPTLFKMKYDMIVRPISSDKIKDNWNVIENSPVVVIDDVGDEKIIVEKYGISRYWMFNDVVRLCEDRSKTLFLTSNLTKNGMIERYKERTVNRLDYLVTAFRIKGASQR